VGSRSIAWVFVVLATPACRPEDQSRPPAVDASTPGSLERDNLERNWDHADDSGGPPLTRDEVRLVIRAKLPVIRACFEAGLEHTPALRGRVLLQFTIGIDGKATDVRVSEDDLGEPSVAACLVELIPTWQFPRPRDDGPITIAYPFAFSSEDSLRAAGLPRVEGTVKPEAVGAVFEARRDELDACLPSGASGTLGVALSIDDAGAVTRISSYADTLPDDAGRCVLRTISAWVFPPAARDDEARVNHDLHW
jgi:hypothetical protein